MMWRAKGVIRSREWNRLDSAEVLIGSGELARGPLRLERWLAVTRFGLDHSWVADGIHLWRILEELVRKEQGQFICVVLAKRPLM